MLDRTPARVLADHSHSVGVLECDRPAKGSYPHTGTSNPSKIKRPPVQLGLTAWTFVPTLAAVAGLLVGYCVGFVPWWLNWLVATPLYCYVLICGHDAVHRTAHGNARINRLVGSVSGFVFAIPFSVVRRAHLSHHARVGKPDDIERFAYRMSWTLPLRWLFGNFCYYAVLPRCTTFERLMAGATLTSVGCLLLVSPDGALFGWLLPMQTTVLIYMVLTIYFPHGPFAEWIDRNMPVVTGFHEDHHAMPNFPWHQLSQRKVRQTRTRCRRIHWHSEPQHQ